MYPIITQKGPRKNGQMAYYVFGVKLTPSNDIDEVLSTMECPKLKKDNSRPILKNFLKENEKENVFSKLCGKSEFTLEDWLNSKEQNLNSFYGIVFNSIADATKGYYPEIYDEILDVAKKFFTIGEQSPFNSIFVSTNLAFYIKVFEALGFSLQKSTEKKIIASSSQIPCMWNGAHINIIKANTMALMMLTNQTTYYDNGIEVPIVLDGVKRTPTTWEDITYEITNSGQKPNPLLYKKGRLLRPRR